MGMVRLQNLFAVNCSCICRNSNYHKYWKNVSFHSEGDAILTGYYFLFSSG